MNVLAWKLTCNQSSINFQNVDDDIISPEDGGVEHDSKMNEISSSENMGLHNQRL